MKSIVTISFLGLLLANCSTLAWYSLPFLKPGDVEALTTQGQKGVVGIGFIEDRNSNPFLARNFQDQLSFELSARGFTTTILETPSPAPSSPTANPAKDDTSDLLPEGLRRVAGETRAGELPRQPTMLRPDQIRTAAARGNLNYVIQGAISRTETGTILELEETAMVSLDVYKTTGEKIGAINFTVKGYSLSDAPLLKSVCRRIAQGFETQIKEAKAGKGAY